MTADTKSQISRSKHPMQPQAIQKLDVAQPMQMECTTTSGFDIFRNAIPGADVERDHDMVRMTFQTLLQNSMSTAQPRIRFDTE